MLMEGSVEEVDGSSFRAIFSANWKKIRTRYVFVKSSHSVLNSILDLLEGGGGESCRGGRVGT